MEHGWIDTIITCISYALSTEAAINVVGILVCDFLEWPTHLVGPEKRICIYFDDCVITLYKCLFTRIRMWLSFSDFELSVLKHLKVIPSQLNSISWVYMRAFQLCVGYKSQKLSPGLFFNLFHLICSSHDNFQNQGLIILYRIIFGSYPSRLGKFYDKSPHARGSSRF